MIRKLSTIILIVFALIFAMSGTAQARDKWERTPYYAVGSVDTDAYWLVTYGHVQADGTGSVITKFDLRGGDCSQYDNPSAKFDWWNLRNGQDELLAQFDTDDGGQDVHVDGCSRTWTFGDNGRKIGTKCFEVQVRNLYVKVDLYDDPPVYQLDNRMCFG